jgi:hypothetical protein
MHNFILQFTSALLPVIATIITNDHSDDGSQHKREAATHQQVVQQTIREAFGIWCHYQYGKISATHKAR